MKKPVYLDYHATTPVDPRVVEAMAPYWTEKFGNAASRNHAYGWEAKKAVERAREQVAALINANPREIVFTSGATESNNLAIKGVAEHAGAGEIVTVVTEHKAVLDPVARLEERGFAAILFPVDSQGFLDLGHLAEAISDKTIILSVMYANNEIGVIQDIPRIGEIVRESGAVFHVDAAQAVGKIPVDVERDGIDLLSISGHKLYAPKGVGALYVRRRGRRVELTQQMDGGGHERGMRSGTLNVPAIVGLGEACALCSAEMGQEAKRLGKLRDRLQGRLLAELDGLRINGGPDRRLPNNLNIAFEGVDGESLLMGLRDVAVSSGSACTSELPEPSHVLRALGLPDKLAGSSLRFGLGRFTTEEEIDYAAERVVEQVKRLRTLAG